MSMTIIDRLKAATGDAKSKASAFIADLVHDLNLAVQSSDIQKVRDIAAHLTEHRDVAVNALTSTGPAKADPKPDTAATGRDAR